MRVFSVFRAGHMGPPSKRYKDHLLANYATGLKGYWPLGDSVGASSVTDVSGNGNTGTPSNVTFGGTGLTGATETAATFAGATNSYVQLEAYPVPVDGSSIPQSPLGCQFFTLVVWFKRTGAGVNMTSGTGNGGILTFEPIMGKGTAEAEGTTSTNYYKDINYIIGIVPGSPNRVGVDFETGYQGAILGGPNHPLTSTSVGFTDTTDWHMLAATYDGSSLKVYLDGVQDATTIATTDNPEWHCKAAAYLGSAVRSDNITRDGAFKGALAHAALWNTALTAAQILDLYSKGKEGSTSPAPSASLVSSSSMSSSSTSIEIQLTAPNSAIDDATVLGNTVVLKRDGVTLVQGTDYAFAYDIAADKITLTPTGIGTTFPVGTYSVILN